MNTSYDWDWNRLREPSPGELKRMDRKAMEIECFYSRMMYPLELEELVKDSRVEYGILRQKDIKMYPFGLSKRIADRGCPEPETLRAIHKTAALAREQNWYTQLCYQAVTKAFKKAEENEMPHVENLNPYDVLSLMMSALAIDRWEARRAREEREGREAMNPTPKPHKTFAEIKALRKQREDMARDILEHGHPQRELLLPSIEAKDPFKTYGRVTKFWMFRRKKKVKGRNSMMLAGGDIDSQAREESWRKEHGFSVGTQDRPPGEDENQYIPF